MLLPCNARLEFSWEKIFSKFRQLVPLKYKVTYHLGLIKIQCQSLVVIFYFNLYLVYNILFHVQRSCITNMESFIYRIFIQRSIVAEIVVDIFYIKLSFPLVQAYSFINLTLSLCRFAFILPVLNYKHVFFRLKYLTFLKF